MPENTYAESIRANRVLFAVAFIALVMLGPSFTLGHMSGYRSGRGYGPSIASPESALSAQTSAKQSKRTDLRKPAARVKTKKSVPRIDPVGQQ